MKVAMLVKLAPRKQGSMERWILGFAEETLRRGHSLDVFGLLPLHPALKDRFEALGVPFSTIDSLTDSPIDAVRRLSAYDVLHLNLFGPRELPALLAYAAWPAKVILVDHISGRDAPLPSPHRKLVSWALDRTTLARVNTVVGVSRYVQRRDMRRFGLSADRVLSINNGVDIMRFRPMRREPGPMSLMTAAYLIPEKGVGVLLQAMDMMYHRDVRLRIAGDGPERERLEKLAHRFRLERRVEFLGLRDDVEALLRESDVFVHPAVWQDACPFTVPEGMAAGCAVVASRVGGIPEYVEHGRSGLLVPPSHPGELAEALDFLAARPERRAQLGQAARARVEDLFTLDRCVQAHLDCVEVA